MTDPETFTREEVEFMFNDWIDSINRIWKNQKHTFLSIDKVLYMVESMKERFLSGEIPTTMRRIKNVKS